MLSQSQGFRFFLRLLLPVNTIIIISGEENPFDTKKPRIKETISTSISPLPIIFMLQTTLDKSFVNEHLHVDNYSEWVVDMSKALYAKNKIGFVDDCVPMPKVDSGELAPCMRCNVMVKGWLKSGMDKDIGNTVCYARRVREMWTNLEERYAKESAPRVFELKNAIALLRQEKSYHSLLHQI